MNLMQGAEFTLAEIMAETSNLPPDRVYIAYAGEGSHEVQVFFSPPQKLVPVEVDESYDREVGF